MKNILVRVIQFLLGDNSNQFSKYVLPNDTKVQKASFQMPTGEVMDYKFDPPVHVKAGKTYYVSVSTNEDKKLKVRIHKYGILLKFYFFLRNAIEK